jgi:hypothetical protein
MPHDVAPSPTTTPPQVSSPAVPQSTTSADPDPIDARRFTNRDSSFDINVMVLSYFPIASDGKTIDIRYTGDFSEPYATTLQRTREMTASLTSVLGRATSYLGYARPDTPPALRYHMIDRHEYKRAVPFDPNTREPHYSRILNEHGICGLVKNRNLKEVWIWAYQGPTYPGSQYAYLNISESKMSGPYGDISNSPRKNDMPQCGKTYTVYVFNYQRGTAEALHSWGHQVESEFRAIDEEYFVTSFQGPYHPQATGEIGRCGSVHNPPNARHEYDYSNKKSQLSDCLNFGSDEVGLLRYVGCRNWGCEDVSDANNAHLNYQIWMWQNLPGRNNTKRHNGVLLRNLWDVHGDFDTVMGQQRTLLSEYYHSHLVGVVAAQRAPGQRSTYI